MLVVMDWLKLRRLIPVQLPKGPPSATLRSRLLGDWLGDEQDEDFDGECILDGEDIAVFVKHKNSAYNTPVQRKCTKIQHNTPNQPP